jgi:two-component system chemotaxis response regulator CheB
MCQLTAKQAETGDYLRPGHVLIAPGDMHMRVVNTLGGPIVECFTGARVHHTMPSADVLFSSVASALKRDAIGVLLTGIGADGARGLKDMLEAGAATIGQDKESSMVYGMSKVAKDMGAVKYELPLSDIAEKIISIFSA